MFSSLGNRMRDGFLRLAVRFYRIKSSQGKAARGFAIGLACNFFPTFGLGGFISGFLARLCGGDMIAGFIGGSLLAPFWPLIFYFNIRVGGLFLRPPIVVDDLEDVTPQTVNALVWGQTFAIGSVINSIVFGILAYFIFLFAYERTRSGALQWLRQRIRSRRALRVSSPSTGNTRP